MSSSSAGCRSQRAFALSRLCLPTVVTPPLAAEAATVVVDAAVLDLVTASPVATALRRARGD
eukprot:13385899-Alexandrium_andersonii.AAC.1